MNLASAKLLALIYKSVVLGKREIVLTSPEKEVQKTIQFNTRKPRKRNTK